MTEYSFLLHTCNLGEQRPSRFVNPFTKEPVIEHLDTGLLEVERTALKRVFDKYGFEGPEPEAEGYVLRFASRGKLRWRSGTYDPCPLGATSFPFELTSCSLTEEALTIILELAQAANCLLMSPFGEDVRIPASLESKAVRSRWPDAALIQSVDDLRDWLINEIGGREVSTE